MIKEYKKLAHFFKNTLKNIDNKVYQCPICELRNAHKVDCIIGKALKKEIPIIHISKPMTYACAHCKTKMTKPQSRSYIDHCSRKCYEESLKLDEEQIERMVRMGLNRREAAESIGMPYETFRRKLIKQGLNHLFPRYPHKFKS